MSTQTIAFGYADNLPVDNPDALIERSVSVPDLGERDLLVRVEAVSVNPVDVKLRASAPADGFRVLGFDASGVVERVGGQVTLFGAGDPGPAPISCCIWSTSALLGVSPCRFRTLTPHRCH
jgi:NADPH2:quinone reductase